MNVCYSLGEGEDVETMSKLLISQYYAEVDRIVQLMELHLNYERVEPYALEQREQQKELTGFGKSVRSESKAKLKADKLKNTIILDTATSLHGVPPEAWEYKLGNRSALEWILDQYKEKKPRDPTIREKFNTYRFADNKAQVLDLLKRVCTVSVRTMEIIRQMEQTSSAGLD
ncbi:MAG: hypothetical protein GY801_23690 [bacterium]|nr:hypothetical protein [bacterium]